MTTTTTDIFQEREERYYQLKLLRDRIEELEIKERIYLWTMEQHGIDINYWVRKYNKIEKWII